MIHITAAEIIHNGNMVSNEDVAEIIVAKGRNVGTGVFYLGFDRKQTKFTNYEFKPLPF